MANNLSKTQIDKLGDRLRKGDITEADLRLLDEYRRSFSAAYEFVVVAIRNELALEPTGRPAKSTTSIAEKLQRESIRLTQVQDIAGCRLVAPEIIDQQRVVKALVQLFDRASVVDRRESPSHGYRAVHVIVQHASKLVEVQVRTSLQHMWAELSEKFSDLIDPAIKYGGGNQDIRELLTLTSRLVAQEESQEVRLTALRNDLPDRGLLDASEQERRRVESIKRDVEAAWKDQMKIRQGLFDFLRETVDDMRRGGGR